MQNFLKPFIVFFVLAILIDAVWLMLIAQSFYVNELRPIARLNGDKFEIIIWSAVVVYLLMALGYAIFVFPQVHTLYFSVIYGGLFGLISYGIYDFTNYASLKDWTLKMVFVDMSWGTFLCALSSALTFFILKNKI